MRSFFEWASHGVDLSSWDARPGESDGSKLCHIWSGVKNLVSFTQMPPCFVFRNADDRSDEWEETRWPASSHAFRPSRMAHSDDADEEEKGEDAGAQHLRGTRKFFVGQWLDVKDTVHNWLEATVMDISHSGEGHGK